MNSFRLALVLLAAAWAVPAHGSIIYSGVQDITIPEDFTGIYLDLTDPADPTQFTTNTDGSGDWELNFFFGGAAIGNSADFLPVTDAAAINANVVDVGPAGSQDIDGSEIYPPGQSGSSSHMTAVGGEFANGVQGYLGFQISDGASGFYNGWMRVTLSDDGGTGTIHDWAWDTMGDAIEVGLTTSPSAVPEASEAVIAALGLLGCALFRRRQRR